MTDLEKSKYFMAGLVTLLTIGILYVLMFIEMPQSSKDVLNIGLGVMLGVVKETFSYIFGSSEGSTTKTAILNSQKENTNETISTPVTGD
jgi:hypothetical protein